MLIPRRLTHLARPLRPAFAYTLATSVKQDTQRPQAQRQQEELERTHASAEVEPHECASLRQQEELERTHASAEVEPRECASLNVERRFVPTSLCRSTPTHLYKRRPRQLGFVCLRQGEFSLSASRNASIGRCAKQEVRALLDRQGHVRRCPFVRASYWRCAWSRSLHRGAFIDCALLSTTIRKRLKHRNKAYR